MSAATATASKIRLVQARLVNIIGVGCGSVMIMVDDFMVPEVVMFDGEPFLRAEPFDLDALFYRQVRPFRAVSR